MNILVATDFSTRSFRALRQAGLLAQAGGQLHVLHVVDDDQPPDLANIEKREAERVLREQIASVPELDGVNAGVLVVEADPFDGILRAARDVGADLIVMGAYGHSRAREYLFGGVTRAMLKEAPLPLLLAH